MKSLRRLSAVVVVAAIMLFTCAVRAQVLQQIPEQALVVVKINSLSSFSTKFGKLATDLQLVAQVPQLADPLAALQDKLKIQNGVDKNGEAAFAYLDPAVAGGNDDKSVLILLPVSDYKAFIGNFADAKEEGGIATVKFADSEEDAYVANWGKYAVVSPSKEIAALKPTGLKVQGAVTAKEMQSKDVVMLANLAQLKTKLQPQLAKSKEEVLEQVSKGMENNEEAKKYTPAVKALVSQLINVADSFLRDAQSATFGITIGDAGISTTLMAEFEPGSYIGNLAKSAKNSDASMLTGLPAGKYLFFGGSVNDPENVAKVFDDLLGPVTTELKTIGDEKATAINKYVDSLRKYVVATKSQSWGMIAPSGAIGQEPLFQIVSIQSGDPAIMKQSYQDMMATQKELMSAFGVPDDAMKTTTTPNAKTIDGVNFDQTHTDMNVGGPNAAQAENMMKIMYGPEGMNALTGVVGDRLIVGFGANDQTLSQTIAAVKAKEDPVGKMPGVATVNAQLPKSRVVAVHLPLDEVITTIGTYAGAMGMPIQIQLPPDLAPIGFTLSSESTAIRVDSYTSTDLIKALVAQGMQLYMQRMGAGGAGGPGGL